VCVDELGRGTSTTDGCAIALSCGKHLMLRNKSRTLFSTHYHKLADYFAFASSAILKHVEALVDSTRVPPRVAFTHKVVSGSCPKSHGVNVARLAGLPETVLQTASAVASRAEKSDEENAFQGGKECSIGARAGVQYLFSRFRDEEKALFFADDEKSGISSAIETVREALFLTHE
jgi:DNA mismatch repair protein MSH6